MFELNIANRLVLDKVFLNGLHALRSIEIKNTSPFPITIKLRSNLGDQIAFQLTNENLPDRRLLPTPLETAFARVDNGTSALHVTALDPLESNDAVATEAAAVHDNLQLSVASVARPTDETAPACASVLDSSSQRRRSMSSANTGQQKQGYDAETLSDVTPTMTAPTAEIAPPSLPPEITTNTVAAAAIGVFGADGTTLHGHQFNQLFNFVNHIDEVTIPAMEVQKIILAFLPDGRGRGHRPMDVGAGSSFLKDDTSSGVAGATGVTAGSSGGNIGRREDLADRTQFSALHEDDEMFDFFEINGLLFFFGFRANQVAASGQSNGGSGTISGAVRFSGDSTSSTDLDSISTGPLTDISLSTPRVSTFTSPDASMHGDMIGSPPDMFSADPTTVTTPEYQITVKFRSHVCRSYLWTDIGETGITFDDCVVGGTYFKDFSIWNRSEIDLYWLLNAVDLSHLEDNTTLKFSDYDTGEPLDRRPLPAYSSRRVRITFKPRDVGEFKYDLQLENANDSSNSVQAQIGAVVRSVIREEILMVNRSSLDFGDCCSGLWVKQRLVIRNVSETPIDIAFSCENASVHFQLKSDDLSEEQRLVEQHHRRSRSLTIAEASEKILFDRLRELSTVDSKTNSEFSNPASSFNSRSSSPTTFTRRDSDLLSGVGNSSVDLFDAVPGAALLGYGDSITSQVVQQDTREEEFTRIEELLLRPGTERTIEVCYCPEKDTETPDYRGGRLNRRTFRVELAYAAQGVLEKKIIQCKARTCTSFVEVSPSLVNFGDTDVGTLKSAPIQIINHSDLPAHVELRFISKVLNCYRGEIVIPPKQSYEVKIDIYPRKVNPEYCKQITVVNLLNRENDQIVEVRSNHIDKNRVTFHSLFYRILTPTSANFIDFGAVILNSPAVRTFTIDNISKKRLVLELASSMPNELLIFAKGVTFEEAKSRPSSGNVTARRREKLLESIGDRRNLKRNDTGPTLSTSTSTSNVVSVVGPLASHASKMRSFQDVQTITGFESTSSPDYLDLASPLSGGDQRRSPKRRGQPITQHGDALQKFRSQLRDRSQTSDIADSQSSALVSAAQPSPGQLEKGIASELETSQVGRITPPLFPQPSSEHDIVPDRLVDKDALVVSAEDLNSTSLADILETSTLPMSAFLNLLEQGLGNLPPLFSKPSAEEKYIKAQQILRRELSSAVTDGRLIPVKSIEVPPEGEFLIVLVMKASGDGKPSIQSKPRKSDAKVFIRLIEFDRDLQQPQFDQLLQSDQSSIPVRELMVRCSLCRSIMELGQKNINFGFLDKNEPRTKTIVVRNKSEAPMLYSIRKSGSIASGDLIIGEGRMGVVRGHGKKEVEFIFDPSLAGPFHERIVIENIQDPDNDQVLTVKANIRNPSKFFVQNNTLDFGSCLTHHTTFHSQHIVISNISTKQTRTIEVKFNPDELNFQSCSLQLSLDLLDEAVDDSFTEIAGIAADSPDVGSLESSLSRYRRRRPTMMLSEETEEQIEALEQKLKIAKRKGRLDKVKKVLEKLEKLRSGNASDASAVIDGTGLQQPADSPTASVTAGFPTKSVASPSLGSSTPVVKFRRTDNSVIFSLEPRAIKTVSVHVKVVDEDTIAVVSSGKVKSELCSGNLYVSEFKNSDTEKAVSFTALVCYDSALYAESIQPGVGDESTMEFTHEEIGFEAPPAFRLDKSRPVSPRVSTKSPPVSSIPDSYAILSQQTEVHMGLIGALGPPSFGAVNDIDIIKESKVSQEQLAEPSFIIERPVIDLGKVEVNERKDCYFTLSNLSNSPLDFKISLSGHLSLGFIEREGKVAARESRRVYLYLIPTKHGRGSDAFFVCNKNTGEESQVTFLYYCIFPTYLRFPSLDSSYGPNGPEIDLGPCYINASKKYATIYPFDIMNVSDQDLVICSTSNLALQCFIFTDSSLDSPALDVQLLPGQRTTVYIALQPYFSVNAQPNAPTATVRLAGSSGTEIRTLVGGIRFMVQVREPTDSTAASECLFHLITQTVRFSALIGLSILNVSPDSLDLGTVNHIGGSYKASFQVVNSSYRLPLEFYLESSDLITLDVTHGRIEGRPTADIDERQNGSASAEGHSLSPSGLISRQVVALLLNCSGWGYITERIAVKNLHNPLQNCFLTVSLFADIGWVSLQNLMVDSSNSLSYSTMSSGAMCSVGEKCDGALAPWIKWNDVYVTTSIEKSTSSEQDTGSPINVSKVLVVIQKKNRAETTPTYEKCFEVTNSSDDVIDLAPFSDVQTSVRWNVSSVNGTVSEPSMEDSTTTASDSNRQRCGPDLFLNPKSKATAFISCPRPTNNGDLNSILSSGRFVQDGTVSFESLKNGFALKIVKVSATYVVSKGDVEPQVIDLGRVGHANNWTDVHFTFVIRNLSDVVLQYEFQTPDAIDILTIDGDPDVSSSRRRVETSRSQIVEALFKPRQVATGLPGLRSLQLTVINLYNPRNLMVVNVSANLTVFEFRFDRLTAGELVLPPLHHPFLPTNIPCDNWFTIVNITDLETKFELGFSLAPDVSQFVRLEVLSRFSNSPIVGMITLAPKGSIEVRVRAFAREDARLPSNSYLLNDEDGVTLGVLLVTPKNQLSSEPSDLGDSNAKKITESIPLRAVIVEGNTFSLSERRVAFRSVTLSDSDDDAASSSHADSRLSLSPQKIVGYTQRETIVLTNLSAFLPLHFRVSVIYPLELAKGAAILKVTPLDSDQCGIVEPGGRLSLDIELLNSKISGLSEDVRINISDVNAILKQSHTVFVSIVEGIPDRNIDATDMDGVVGRENLELFVDDTADDYDHQMSQSLIGGASFRLTDEGSTNDEDEELWLSDVASSSYSAIGDKSTGSTNRPSVADNLRRTNALGLIILRGCKRVTDVRGASSDIGNLFELDLGQQDMGSSAITKRLLLENGSTERVSYRVRYLSESDKSWLQINRSEGTLESSRPSSSLASNSGASLQRDSHSVTLTFSTNMRGVFSTYVFIENVDNFADSKTLRVSMEIVARQNIRRTGTNLAVPSAQFGLTDQFANTVFDVLHSCIETERDGVTSIIEMDNLYYDTDYTARSLIIKNNEAVPLEFTMKSSLPLDDPSELVFSLSRTSAKLFRSLTIEPEGHSRIYLRFRPSLGLQSSYSSSKVDELNMEIFVNCRLVKDYQKVLKLRAICRAPQIAIDSPEFTFQGTIERRELTEDINSGVSYDLHLNMTQVDFPITNRFTETLICEIVNDTSFFSIALSEGDKMSLGHSGPFEVQPNSSRLVRLSVIWDELIKNAESLRRERYVLEHMMLYNKRRPSEKYVILLKLSLGHLGQFQSASGSRRSHSVIEARIVRLLKEINANPVVSFVVSGEDEWLSKAFETYFQYYHIVNELIYYATREHGSDNYLKLAQLLFTGVFNNSIFKELPPSPLRSSSSSRRWSVGLNHWVSSFTELLAHFPNRSPTLDPLLALSRNLATAGHLI